MASESSRKKPPLPYPDFPLWPAPNGQWCKKIRQRVHYFGVWADWKAALEEYNRVRDDLHAGRKPRPKAGDGMTLKLMCNHFLLSRERRLQAGTMTAQSFQEYRDALGRMLDVFGKDRLADDLQPADFEELKAKLAKTDNGGLRGPHSLGGLIQRIRSAFKYAFEARLIDRPAYFGTEFRKPDKVQYRRARQSRPRRFFEAAEIRQLLDVASVHLKAMILLGVNVGFGPADLAALPLSAVDLERGIIDFPRPKTAIERRAVLWSETIEALKASIAKRPKAKDPADEAAVFLTKYGRRWTRFNAKGSVISGVTQEFGKAMKECGIEREGCNFYALRHVAETIGGGCGDQAAVDRVLGHERGGIADAYREWTRDEREDARLRAVADHIHAWLWPTPAADGKGTKRKPRKGKPALKLVG